MNVQGNGVVLNEADIESVSSVELDIGTWRRATEEGRRVGELEFELTHRR